LDITPFIRELILLNECVILRGIGGFETTYKNAIYRKAKKIIVPPSKRIQFQPEWIKDNGVLENHLVKSLGISNEKASEHIDNYVQEFHNQIRKEGKVLLEGIGEFAIDKEQRIHFKELEDANYLADSFGLDVLNIEPDIENYSKPVTTNLTPLTPGPRKLSGLYIAIGILLLMISITFIILISEGKEVRLFNIKKNSGSTDEVVIFGPSSDLVADSISRAVEQVLDHKTTTRNALTLEKTSVPDNREVVTEISGDKIAYYLVAGSFKTMRNAEILKEQLVRKGFSPEILHTGNMQYRVVVGTYYEHRRAIEELRRIRIQLDQSVWLLEAQQN